MKLTTNKKQALRRVGAQGPLYSRRPEVAAIELIDGAYDVIEIWDAETPAQRAWKAAWMAKARELGANPSW